MICCPTLLLLARSRSCSHELIGVSQGRVQAPIPMFIAVINTSVVSFNPALKMVGCLKVRRQRQVCEALEDT